MQQRLVTSLLRLRLGLESKSYVCGRKDQFMQSEATSVCGLGLVCGIRTY